MHFTQSPELNQFNVNATNKSDTSPVSVQSNPNPLGQLNQRRLATKKPYLNNFFILVNYNYEMSTKCVLGFSISYLVLEIFRFLNAFLIHFVINSSHMTGPRSGRFSSRATQESPGNEVVLFSFMFSFVHIKFTEFFFNLHIYYLN